MLTLLINATTTGFLVKYLDLASQTGLQKNLLVGVTRDLDKHIDDHIEKLEFDESYFNVDWERVKECVNLTDLKARISTFSDLSVSVKLKVSEVDVPPKEGDADKSNNLDQTDLNIVDETKK